MKKCICRIKQVIWFLYVRIYSVQESIGFKFFGSKSYIQPSADLIIGKQYISVGCKTCLGKHIQLTAWGSHNGETFTPSIIIGSNCQLGAYNHITAINSIKIGNGVLTGKFVTISDNSHGMPGDPKDYGKSPIKRIVYSKGPIDIGDNVWIGDKATILPNVRIGEGCIIGANTVVTKDVPSYSIVIGNPARIIKKNKKSYE